MILVFASEFRHHNIQQCYQIIQYITFQKWCIYIVDLLLLTKIW